MVTFINRGDIFKIDGVKNYAHGCNCAGAMGKGIAIQFKKRFPIMYKRYKELCDSGAFSLGDVFLYDYGSGYVFNLGTQISWKTKAEIKAIEQCLEKMLAIAVDKRISKIGLPKIGSGLGGLNWLDVKEVIERTSNKYKNIELFVVEEYETFSSD